MPRLTALVCLTALSVSAAACGGAQVRPLDAQLAVLCEGVALEAAAHTGGDPSPLIEKACLASLRRAFDVQPELAPAPFPDAGQ